MSAAAHEAVTHSANESADEGLSDLQRGVLEIERDWWRFAGAKETAIRERLEMSATTYYQLLNRLIDSEAALRHDPLLIKRLRRMRDRRHRERSARRQISH